MRSVFITGSAGFIGSYAVREFINRGWFVFALVHKKTSDEIIRFEKTGKLGIIKGSITDCDAVRESLELEIRRRNQKLHVIVHCAGRASDTGWRSEFRKTNYEAVKNSVCLAEYFKVERFVFISTTDVYGMKDFHGESEDRILPENNTGNYYPEFKILSEKWITEKLPEHQYSIIRPAQVWGIGDRTLTPRIVDFLGFSPFILHFGKWKGKNRWPLAHVKNVASSVYLAATSPEAAGQAFTVADDESTSIDDFYRIIAEIYLPHKKHRTVSLPFWTGLLVGSIVSLISTALNLKRPFADPSLYALYSVSRNLDFSNRKIRSLFISGNMKFIALEEGIAEIRADRQEDGLRETMQS